jgi:hypothetical protein
VAAKHPAGFVVGDDRFISNQHDLGARGHEFGRCFDRDFGADPVGVPDREGKSSVFAGHKLTSSHLAIRPGLAYHHRLQPAGSQAQLLLMGSEEYRQPRYAITHPEISIGIALA